MMRSGKPILVVLFVTCCLAFTLEARGASPETSLNLGAGDLSGREQSGEGLRAQSREPAPVRPIQLQIELSTEGDPPFEPGKPIQFAARAEPWKQDLEYRYFFGDGSPTGWLSDSRFPHSYDNPGTYQVYVEARSRSAVFTFADTAKSNILRAQVAQREVAISVGLELLGRPPFRVGEPLRFAARTKAAGLRLEYQFLFGDGRPSSWRHQNTAQHTYTEAGTYQAVVLVREQPLEGQLAPPLANAKRAMLRVVVQPEPFRNGQQVARLAAYPVEIQAGEPVRLQAHPQQESEDVGFVFEFGDGQRSERQSEQTTEHRYANPGAYDAFVRIYRMDRMVEESQPIRIVVTPGVSHRLSLEADNTNPRISERVRFTWRIEPPVAGVLYHVDFGDSYSGWVSEAGTEHAYRNTGEYRGVLRARVGGRDIQSNEIAITVRGAAWNRLYTLCLSLAIALGAAGVVVLVWRVGAKARSKKGAKSVEAGSVASNVVVQSYKDPGAHRLEFSAPAAEDSDVRIQPVPDMGEQVMGQGMIMHKRREANHG